MAERILVVDDDVDTLRLVGLMLKRQGYEILAASNGTKAVALAQKEQPDLILLDVMMPDMDGFEVARRLRSDPTTEDIPIIMFTAKTQIDDKVTGFESGADDYLTKPTHPAELIAHVRALLNRSKKMRTRAVQSAPSRPKGKVIGVLAAKGGLGVTTLALNLGVVLRQKSGQQVIVTDYRPGQGSLSVFFGYTKGDGLNHLLDRELEHLTPHEIEGLLVPHSSGVRLLFSSPRPSDARFLNATAHFEAITRHLAFMADFVLIDLGPSLPPTTQAVLKWLDELLVVVEPVPGTIDQTRMLLEDLAGEGVGQGRVGVVLVNRTRSSIQIGWRQVQEMLGQPVVTVFSPAPELAFQAEQRHIPLVLLQPDSLTAQQFEKLTEHVRIGA